MKLGTQIGLGPDHIVLDGDPAPPPPKGGAEIFGHICCGQTAEWIKMALGTEVGLGPGYVVLDWNPAPLPKNGGGAPSQFSVHFYCGHKRLDASRCHSV